MNCQGGRMATSSDLLDDTIKEFLTKLSFDSCLDIGAGEGKFGKMIRSLKKARIVAIEPDTTLECKEYDEVKRITANEILDLPDFKTDIAIMGDVIEHLKKSEGIDLLNYLFYRTKYIIVKFPFYYPQYGSKFVRHKSVWNFDDFDDLNLPLVLKETEDYMGLVIIKGLISMEVPNVKSFFKKVKKI